MRRPHARDTPRDDADLLQPPPRGTKWQWRPTHINADGANAGPNGIKLVLEARGSWATCKDCRASRPPCTSVTARPIAPVPSRPFAHPPSKPDRLILLSLRRSEDTVIKEAGRKTGVAESYLKQFQALVRKPAETIKKQEFALKDLIDWEKVKSCPPFKRPSPSLNDPHSLRG